MATRLVCARTRRDEFGEVTFIGQRLQNVTRTRINVEGNAIVQFMAPHDGGRAGEVPEAGIGGGADVGLVDVRTCHLANGHYVGRAPGFSDQRLKNTVSAKAFRASPLLRPA